MKKQNNAIIGIYKITSPKGKIYVGQSRNINHRFYLYSKLCCRKQTKLYNSLEKYGPENHMFEIIEECSLDKLDELEIYWINKFACINDGLNLKEGGSYGCHSQETKDKISISKKGNTIINKEWASNISKGRQGLKHDDSTKEKIRKGNLYKIISQETRNKQRNKKLGTKRTIESKIKQSNSSKNKSKSNEFKIKMSKSILQYDLDGNFIKKWNSIKEAALTMDIDKGTLCACLKERQKTCNKFKWKYE